MLARFENGYFLEVVIEKDIYGIAQYAYHVYDEDFWSKDCGWTEYRSMELHYPMNEIDYILNYCNPKFVKCKYELLPYERMEDYEDYLDDLKYGESDGDWVLERQGTDDDDIRYYKTEEDAKAAAIIEANELSKEMKHSYLRELWNGCEVSKDEYYQRWSIYKKPTHKTEFERILNEIQLNINRAYIGIDQYACELQDTYVAYTYLDKLDELVNQLKEMI